MLHANLYRLFLRLPGTLPRWGAMVFGFLKFFHKSTEELDAYLPIPIKSDIKKAAGNRLSQWPFLLRSAAAWRVAALRIPSQEPLSKSDTATAKTTLGGKCGMQVLRASRPFFLLLAAYGSSAKPLYSHRVAGGAWIPRASRKRLGTRKSLLSRRSYWRTFPAPTKIDALPRDSWRRQEFILLGNSVLYLSSRSFTMRGVLALGVSLLLATVVLAADQEKAQEGGQHRRPAGGGFDVFRILQGLDLSADQKAKLEDLKKELGPKLKEAGQKVDSILTDDQKKARADAWKAGQEAGKSMEEIRQAVEEALKLTDDQKTKMADARKAMGEVMKEAREKMLEILTPEQKEQVQKKMAERMSQMRKKQPEQKKTPSDDK